jgi:Domain of unknown function (DUF6901)
MTEPLAIRYRFTLLSGRDEIFELHIDRQGVELQSAAPQPPPPWARLGFHQCPNCPLSADTHPLCPAAAKLADVVPRFEPLLSYDPVRLEVETEERKIVGETTAQQALSSMLGLIMATSGCPHTAFLKGMARFHLPLASEEETVFRSVATYVLAQYLRQRAGATPDPELAGLQRIYRALRVVNAAFTKRLRAAGRADATLNALVLLDVFAIIVPTAVEDSLAELAAMLQPVLEHLDAH